MWRLHLREIRSAWSSAEMRKWKRQERQARTARKWSRTSHLFFDSLSWTHAEHFGCRRCSCLRETETTPAIFRVVHPAMAQHWMHGWRGWSPAFGRGDWRGIRRRRGRVDGYLRLAQHSPKTPRDPLISLAMQSPWPRCPCVCSSLICRCHSCEYNHARYVFGFSLLLFPRDSRLSGTPGTQAVWLPWLWQKISVQNIYFPSCI